MVLRRDRIIVLAGLISVAALAWAYTVYLAHDMGNMHMGMGMGMAMPKMQSWSLMDFVSMFLMWAVMMVAMMVPTAAPMILIFANVNRKRQEQERPYVPTAVFLSGYLLVWIGFSVLATLAQWGLHEAALLSPMMVSTSPILGGILLLAAGIFQWTPLKYACLKHCRSPLSFLMTDWREGYRGALIMGLKHGSYCTGCCWFLMALLFVAGVMNLLWVATITAFVLVEKAVPRGDLVGRIAGVALCIAGLIMLVQVWS
jgi:predicted metal-binding membrane protein